MRRLTMMQAGWRAESQSGDCLAFERCKGGYFSTDERYGLRVVGKTTQNGLTGKNLAPTEGIERGFWNEQGGGQIWDGACRLPAISIPDNWNSLTISSNLPLGGVVLLMDGLAGGYTASPTISTSTFSGLSVKVWLNGPLEALKWVQVEKGDTATPYEPYCGGTRSPNPAYTQPIHCVKAGTRVRCTSEDSTVQEITAPCDLYEGDVWYPATGRVERCSAIKVFDGTEIFSESYMASANCLITPLPNTGESYLYCTHSKKSDRATNFANRQNLRLDIDYFGVTGAADMKAFLAAEYANGTPLTVCYLKQTPTTEQYAPQSMSAKQGAVMVESVSGDTTEEMPTLAATMLVRRQSGSAAAIREGA